jgi:hypothetical protein
MEVCFISPLNLRKIRGGVEKGRNYKDKEGVEKVQKIL